MVFDKDHEIAHALLTTCLNVTETDNADTLVLDRKYDFVNKVRFIEEVIKIHSKSPLFVIKKSSNFDFHISESGKLFLKLIQDDPRWLEEHLPFYSFNPYVRLFLDHAKTVDPYIFAPIRYSKTDSIKLIDTLNSLVSEIRAEAGSKKFQNDLKKHRRSARKNYSSFLSYLHNIFERHARLMVIRVDLGFNLDFIRAHNANVDGIVDPEKVRSLYEFAKKGRNNFIRTLKRKVFPDSMLGYVWKLEYGLNKSLHFHFMLILNGAEVRGDVTIAKMIGDLWNNKITNGHGTYFNCNANKAGYKSCGIGNLQRINGELPDGLIKTALYMTKTDYFIKAVAPDGGRVFGKGEGEKLPTIRRGRPRQQKLNSGRTKS